MCLNNVVLDRAIIEFYVQDSILDQYKSKDKLIFYLPEFYNILHKSNDAVIASKVHKVHLRLGLLAILSLANVNHLATLLHNALLNALHPYLQCVAQRYPDFFSQITPQTMPREHYLNELSLLG